MGVKSQSSICYGEDERGEEMTSKDIKQLKKNYERRKRIVEKVGAEHEPVKVEPEIEGAPLYQEKVIPYFDLIGAWIRDGLSESAIAERLGISKSTIERYQRNYPSFAELWKRNRERLDYVDMINAYQRRAEGYTTIELEQEFKVLDDGTRKLVKEKKRERHIPADPRALENWIQLRMKNDPMWGELRAILHDKNVEVGGEGGLIFIPAKKVLELQNDNGNEKGNDMESPTETT